MISYTINGANSFSLNRNQNRSIFIWYLILPACEMLFSATYFFALEPFFPVFHDGSFGTLKPGSFCIASNFFRITNDTLCSSEIHEKMCCNRCRQHEMTPDSSLESEHMNGGCQIDEEDIGGFAGIAGCFKSLKSHEKQVSEFQNILILGSRLRSFAQKTVPLQVGTPKEEDLASWGHHYFPSTVPDLIFQASAGDEVRISSDVVSALVFLCWKIHSYLIRMSGYHF